MRMLFEQEYCKYNKFLIENSLNYKVQVIFSANPKKKISQLLLSLKNFYAPLKNKRGW